MRLQRPASEDEMVAVFLAAEVTSERYSPQVTEILARLGQPRGIVEQPDTRDETASALRRQVLAAYRGYPAGDVFTGMPADVRWHHAALTPAELAAVRYIDYGYWTGFSGGTRLAADGARRLGPWQHQPPGTIYRQIAENLRDGQLPAAHPAGRARPGEPGRTRGHKRLTGLLLCPQWLPAELNVLLGLTARHSKQPNLPRSQRQPVPGRLTPAFRPHPVRVAVPPALLRRLVQPGVQLLDQAGVLLGMHAAARTRGLGSFCSRFTSPRNRSYTTKPAPHGQTRCSALTRTCSSAERSCASSTPGPGTGRHPRRFRLAMAAA
jgi:hypothetical protein